MTLSFEAWWLGECQLIHLTEKMNLENLFWIKVYEFCYAYAKFQTPFLPISQISTQIFGSPPFPATNLSTLTSSHLVYLFVHCYFGIPSPSTCSEILLRQVITFNTPLIIPLYWTFLFTV